MMEISAQQVSAFESPLRVAFRARVRAFLESQAPQVAAKAGEHLDARIDRGRDEAERLGCVTEQELVLFIVLALIHGDDFATTQPWARDAIAEHKAAGVTGGLPQTLRAAAPVSGTAAGRD